MKTTLLAVLLVLSLAANAALYFQRGSSSAAPGSDEKSASLAAKSGAASTTAAADAPAAAAAKSKAEVDQLTKVRALLQTSDVKALIAQLRAAGFSSDLIRAIVAGKVNDQFSARRKALIAGQEEIPFWKTQQRMYMDPKTMSAIREISREQTNLMKELLGPDGMPGNDEMQAYQRRQFGNLSREKLEQLQSISGDYNDLRSQIYAAANGVWLPEDREKLALLEKEQRADMVKVLSPQELEDYDLRSSTTANQLRSQLIAFNPTEAEFRALFKLQQAFDDKYGSGNMIASAEQYRQRQEQQKELLAQAQTVLAPDRYDAFKQAVDPNYQMINRIVARMELPATAATQVVTAQQDIMKRATTIRMDQTLTPEQRTTQLSALSQEATTRVTTALGTRGYEAYKQYGGGWMQNIARPMTPPPTPRG